MGYYSIVVWYRLIQRCLPSRLLFVPTSPIFRGYKSLVVYNSAHSHCRFAYQLDILLLRKVVTIFLQVMKHFCGIYLF